MKTTGISAECKDDIKSYIRNNFNGTSLETRYMSNLIDLYGMERVKYVLANTIQMNEEDGRYSPSNKEWARQININNEEKDRRIFIVDSHPAIVDGFVSALRKIEKEMDKTKIGDEKEIEEEETILPESQLPIT